MKIQELIDLLSKFDPDREVVVWADDYWDTDIHKDQVSINMHGQVSIGNKSGDLHW